MCNYIFIVYNNSFTYGLFSTAVSNNTIYVITKWLSVLNAFAQLHPDKWKKLECANKTKVPVINPILLNLNNTACDKSFKW